MTAVAVPAAEVATTRSESDRAGWRLSGCSALIGLVFAGPLFYVIWRNLALGTDLGRQLFDRDTLTPLLNTITLATMVSATTAVLGTALAWLTMRTDLPGRRVFKVVLALPLVFPSFVGALALLSALAPGGLLDARLGFAELPELSGLWGAWWVLTLFTYPYVYLPVAARLRTLPPSLEENARLLGRGPWPTFWSVVLPQSVTAVGAGTLLVFLYTISDFGAVQLMRYDTLTVDIFAARLVDRSRSFSLALVLALLALVVVAGERAISRGRRRVAAVAGTTPLLVPLGRWKAPALAGMVTVIGVALVGPLAGMAHWAQRQVSGAESTFGADLGGLMVPTLNTALIAVAAAVVALVVVLPVAYLSRHRSAVGEASQALVVGGFALPGLVIALALVFWVLNAPGVGGLYQTIPLLILAYVIHFGAQSMGAARVAVSGVPRRYDDAARILGAGRVRRLATIDLPLMAPGLAAGAGLVMLSTLKELPATLLLRPTGFDTLAVRIWGAGEDGFLGEVGLTSLVLVGLSAVLTWLLVLRRIDAPEPAA